MTIATLSYPPAIRPTGVGFARAIMRTGAIAGLIFWPMLWGALKTGSVLLVGNRAIHGIPDLCID